MFRVTAPTKPQTPRAKQTRPSGPARRSARVNSRPGNGELAEAAQ